MSVFYEIQSFPAGQLLSRVDVSLCFLLVCFQQFSFVWNQKVRVCHVFTLVFLLLLIPTLLLSFYNKLEMLQNVETERQESQRNSEKYIYWRQHSFSNVLPLIIVAYTSLYTKNIWMQWKKRFDILKLVWNLFVQLSKMKNGIFTFK